MFQHSVYPIHGFFMLSDKKADSLVKVVTAFIILIYLYIVLGESENSMLLAKTASVKCGTRDF